MKRHAAEIEKREALRLKEDAASEELMAELRARLEAAVGRADEAEATAEALAEALAESKTAFRRKGDTLRRSIARGEACLRDIQTKATSSGSSSNATTYTEEEVEEMEGVMGDLTAQLAELRKSRKDDEAEYDRNRRAVAAFRSKYSELADLKRANLALEAEVERLTAERDARGQQAPRAPGATHEVPIFDIQRDSSKRGSPYPTFFADVIAPAMLDTGATPEQINAIIRNPPPPPLFLKKYVLPHPNFCSP